MKKYIFVLISFLVLSCSKENDEYYLFSFTEKSELTIIEDDYSYMNWSKVSEGEDLVFEYQYNAPEEENISDDEYAEFIRFQINPNLRKFSYKNDQLTTIKAVFSKSCFCGFGSDPNKDVPPTGTINGEKISDTKWRISIDVTFYGDENRNITNIFVLKN